jgi:hypothetical protein
MTDRDHIKAESNKARKTPRWTAVAHYHTDAGMLDVMHDVMELSELQELIEAGPDWHALDRIEIRLNREGRPVLTIEEAAKQ